MRVDGELSKTIFFIAKSKSGGVWSEKFSPRWYDWAPKDTLCMLFEHHSFIKLQKHFNTLIIIIISNQQNQLFSYFMQLWGISVFILFVVLAKLNNNNNKSKLVLSIKVCPKLLESLCRGVFGSGVSHVYVISAMKIYNCTQNIFIVWIRTMNAELKNGENNNQRGKIKLLSYKSCNCNNVNFLNISIQSQNKTAVPNK